MQMGLRRPAWLSARPQHTTFWAMRGLPILAATPRATWISRYWHKGEPMAAVTIVGSPVYNVVGSRRSQLYRVTGNTTNTLDVGLRTINEINVEPTATNPPTVTF